MGSALQRTPLLTAHAVIRYVQRVHGIDLEIPERSIDARFIMHVYLYAAGVTLEQVTAFVLTDGVKALMAAGASRIPTPYGSRVVRNMAVVTVLDPPEPNPHPKKLRILNKLEKKRNSRRHHHQLKRGGQHKRVHHEH